MKKSSSMVIFYLSIAIGFAASLSYTDVFVRIGFGVVLSWSAFVFLANKIILRDRRTEKRNEVFIVVSLIIFLFFSAVAFVSQDKIIASYFIGGSATFIAPFILAWHLSNITTEEKTRGLYLMGVCSIFISASSAAFSVLNPGDEYHKFCHPVWMTATALCTAWAWGVTKTTNEILAISLLSILINILSGSRIMMLISTSFILSGLLLQIAPRALLITFKKPGRVPALPIFISLTIGISVILYAIRNPAVIDELYTLSRIEFTVSGFDSGVDESMQGRNMEIPSIAREIDMNWTPLNYFLGSGHGAHFRNVYSDDIAIGGDRLHNVHYFYVGMYFRYGLIGLAVMAFYWFCALRLLWMYSKNKASSLDVIIAIASIGVLSRCFVENGMQRIESPVILALLLNTLATPTAREKI